MTKNEVIDEITELIRSLTGSSYYRVPLADVGKRLIEEIEKKKEVGEQVLDGSSI